MREQSPRCSARAGLHGAPGVSPPQMVPYTVELRGLVGQPSERILETAAQEHMALIVFNTHGRMGLIHLMMGSGVERVVLLAPCPVLTVKISPADTQAVPSPSVP
jgi:nucleotide-binding universal stress UspA family protein